MPANRFNETVNIRTQNLSTGFVEGSGSLLSKLNEFGRSADSLIGVVEQKRGQKQAKEDFSKTGKFKKKEASIAESILTGGISTKAYNQSLKTAYLSSISSDIVKKVNDIETENKNDVIAFNEKTSGYLSGVLKGADPSLQEEISNFASAKIETSRTRVYRNTITKNKSDARAASLDSINTFSREAEILSREGDKLGASEAISSAFVTIDAMMESGDLTLDKASNMKRSIEREAAEQGKRLQFDSIIENDGVLAASKELNLIANKPGKGWTPDEWLTYIKSQRADIRSAALAKQESSAKSDLAVSKSVSDLKIQANTGINLDGSQAIASDIVKKADDFFDKGFITGNERASIITKMVNKQKVDFKNSLIEQKVASRMSDNQGVIVSKDDVDYVWDNNLKDEVNAMPSQSKSASIASFVDSVKRIPTSVVTEVVSDLNSGNVELTIAAVDLMDRLDDVRGIPKSAFKPEDVAFAENVLELQKNIEPVEAVKLALQNTDPNDIGRINTRKETIKSDLTARFGGLDYAGVINDEFNDLFGDAPNEVAKGQLVNEYKSLYESYFIAGMTEKGAEKKAVSLLKRNWKQSEVTNQYMKYSPDDYYAVNGGVDYIKEDLFKSVIDNNVGIGDITQGSLLLISDQQTAREATSSEPSYLVMINTGNGLMPLAKFRYKPDKNAEITRLAELSKDKASVDRANRIEQQKQLSDTLENFPLKSF